MTARSGPQVGRPQTYALADGVANAAAPTTLRQKVLRFIFAFRDTRPDNAVTPQEAVTTFLGTMASNAGNTCGMWNQQLEGALNRR